MNGLQYVALVDAMRTDDYWQQIRQGDANLDSHDVQPYPGWGARCARCGAVNYRMRVAACSPTTTVMPAASGDVQDGSGPNTKEAS